MIEILLYTVIVQVIVTALLAYLCYRKLRVVCGGLAAVLGVVRRLDGDTPPPASSSKGDFYGISDKGDLEEPQQYGPEWEQDLEVDFETQKEHPVVALTDDDIVALEEIASDGTYVTPEALERAKQSIAARDRSAHSE